MKPPSERWRWIARALFVLLTFLWLPHVVLRWMEGTPTLPAADHWRGLAWVAWFVAGALGWPRKRS